MRNQVNAVQSIANAVSIPVGADGGAGFGNALSSVHILRLMEPAGAAGADVGQASNIV
ncbi:hypothetical protein [Azospirillum endophyticum]